MNQITLNCIDLDISTHFYGNVLGFQLIVYDKESHYARFNTRGGNNGSPTLSLHVAQDIDKFKQSISMASQSSLYFEYPTPQLVDEAHIKLKNKGVTIVQSPEMKSWLWYEMLLVDPDGRQIIIYSAQENRLNPPWVITNAETLLKEIGDKVSSANHNSNNKVIEQDLKRTKI
jgi:catechol 2,3-dioxygenase-like lactoylglutathione lyase family enzyme